MNWWHIVIPAALIAFIWMMTRPVRREVQRGDFGHWYHEVLINSKKGAWVEIADVDRKAALIARKLDGTGQQLSLELRTPEGIDAEEVASSMREGWDGSGVTCSAGTHEGTGLLIRVDLGSADAVEGVAAGVVRFFDTVGSVPGCRFRLRAKGRTDPEALRPLVDTMQRQSKGARSKAWGKALEKSLDRRRDRQ